jgi:hypothetical protein
MSLGVNSGVVYGSTASNNQAWPELICGLVSSFKKFEKQGIKLEKVN